MMFDNDSHIMSLADLNSLIRDCAAKVTKVRAERSDSAPGVSPTSLNKGKSNPLRSKYR